MFDGVYQNQYSLKRGMSVKLGTPLKHPRKTGTLRATPEHPGTPKYGNEAWPMVRSLANGLKPKNSEVYRRLLRMTRRPPNVLRMLPRYELPI